MNRVLVYQSRAGDWMGALARLKAEGLRLGVEVRTRRVRCYRGVERAVRVLVDDERIASAYRAVGVEVEPL